MTENEPKVQWLIENGPFDENIAGLCEEIERQGMSVKTMRGIPFEDNIVVDIPAEACVVVLGSINFVKRIQRSKPWVPGALANWDNYRFSTCAAYYRERMINHEFSMAPFRVWKDQYDILPDGIHTFLKPNDGSKHFTGCLVRKPDNGDIAYITSKVKPDTLVIESKPRKMKEEYRCVVADGKIISASQYRNEDGISIRSDGGFAQSSIENIENFISKVGWVPDRMFCLDMGNYTDYDDPHTLKGGIIEINSFNCSGLYACPLEPIIREASRIAMEEWREVH